MRKVRQLGPGHVYGPVPSRRLGRSLGIDLVPFKVCTYDCIYCQLGRTGNRTIQRREYVSIDDILSEVKEKLTLEPLPDYITLAGSGEPTLNSRIGELISLIKRITRVPVAVCTNGALLWQAEVRYSLRDADLVLPSLDAGDHELFGYVNRPTAEIHFDQMVEGLVSFVREFKGPVWLEVMLLGGITAIPKEVKKIARLVRKIKPARTQLNTASRPPAEEYAIAVGRSELDRLALLIPGTVEVISEHGLRGGARPGVRATAVQVMAMLSRRPCTIQDVASGLGVPVLMASKVLDRLVSNHRAKTVLVGGQRFYAPTGTLTKGVSSAPRK
ncbi:MAG: radical SAM protein [candidate division WOR-3 bacterium]